MNWYQLLGFTRQLPNPRHKIESASRQRLVGFRPSDYAAASLSGTLQVRNPLVLEPGSGCHRWLWQGSDKDEFTLRYPYLTPLGRRAMVFCGFE